MRSVIKFAAVCVAALLVVACSSGYRGYGEFTDNGAATTERYVVDFGKISLGKPNQKAFNMAGLPHVEFTMGLRPVDFAAGCNAVALGKVNIALQVQSEDGAVAIAEDAPFGSWVSGAKLVYRHGTSFSRLKAPRPILRNSM